MATMEIINKYLAECSPDGPVLGIKAIRKIGKHVDALLLGPDDTKLLTELVRCLNAPGDELRLKELAMELLAKLSAKPQHIPLVQTALGGITEGFESFFNMATGLESDTVSRGLHVSTLTLFYRISDFNLTGADLLELTTTIPSSLHALTSIFLEQSLPHDLHVAAADTLMQLTLPDTYFADAKCTDMTDLERLTAQYNEQVNVLMKEAMDQGLFTVIGGLLRPWIRHCSALATRYSGGDKPSSFLEPLHAVMAGVLKFIVNLLNYSTTRGKKFRHHLAVDTDIIAEVVLPYIMLIVDALNKAGAAPADRDLAGLRLALMVLVVATFKIKTLRGWLRRHNFAQRMLEVEGATRDGVLLSLLIKLNINIDFAIPASTTPVRVSRKARLARVEADSRDELLPSDTQLDPEAAKIVKNFREAMRELDVDAREKLRRRLGVVDPAAPVNKNCRSYEILSFTMNSLHFDIDRASESDRYMVGGLKFDLPGMDSDAGDSDAPAAVVGETPRLGRSALSMLSQWQSEREGRSTRGRARPAKGATEGATPATAAAETSAGPEVDSPAADADAGPAVEEDALAPAVDEGPAADKDAPAGPPSESAPATGSGGAGGAGAGAGAGAGSRARAPHHVKPLARARAPHHLRPLGAASGSLPPSKLGRSLPPAGATAGKRSVKPIGSESSVPVPAAHMCRLTKALMEDPVVTPGGIHYERHAIEDHLAAHETCPVTGDPLTLEQLKPATELKKEIQLFQFRRLMLSSRLR